MICKNYVVSGEDVNGNMVMEDTAYIAYTLRLLYLFLFHNGFSRQKFNNLNIGLQEKNHVLVCYKNLMFTEPFVVEIKYFYIADKISVKNYFFNSKNECCAEVTEEIEWFDHLRREVISTPKKILHHFNPNTKSKAKS